MTERLYSLSEAAKVLGQPLWRVQYAMNKDYWIPTNVVGHTIVLDDDDLERLGEALRTIGKRKRAAPADRLRNRKDRGRPTEPSH